MKNPFQVVRDFEQALCDYTGAPYCVTTTSCTMALLLAASWAGRSLKEKPVVSVPKRTYVGVPMSLFHAGYEVQFVDMRWGGYYDLFPLPVFDSARWLTANIYDGNEENMMCLSFHPTKHLGISTHGGAILHDDSVADEFLRMMRFDGRQEGVEPRNQYEWVMGYHCYMNPVTAAEGLQRLSTLPIHNQPLPNSNYPDLSKLEIFNA